MKKLLILFLGILALQTQAQVKKVLKHTNEIGDITSFELDCTSSFPSLAKGLKYNITRYDMKGQELRSVFRILMVMDGFYSKIKTNEILISAELSNGEITTQKQPLEEDGFFDGTVTLKMDLIKAPVELTIKKIILHAGKDIVYDIPEKNAISFTKNLNAVFLAK